MTLLEVLTHITWHNHIGDTKHERTWHNHMHYMAWNYLRCWITWHYHRTIKAAWVIQCLTNRNMSWHNMAIYAISHDMILPMGATNYERTWQYYKRYMMWHDITIGAGSSFSSRMKMGQASPDKYQPRRGYRRANKPAPATTGIHQLCSSESPPLAAEGNT